MTPVAEAYQAPLGSKVQKETSAHPDVDEKDHKAFQVPLAHLDPVDQEAGQAPQEIQGVTAGRV